MSYEKDLKEIWDEYATRKTLEEEHTVALEEAKEQGIEKGREKEREEIVRNLLLTQKFTVEEIANFPVLQNQLFAKLKWK